METLYIKLKNGTDIVSNTTVETDTLLLNKPMAVKSYADSTGRISLAFQEWIPMDFVDREQFSLNKNEVLIMSSTSVKIREFYFDCLKKPLEEEVQTGEVEGVTVDGYNQLMKLLGTKRLLH